MTTASRQLARQIVGTRSPHAEDNGNPDTNPDKVSGFTLLHEATGNYDISVKLPDSLAAWLSSRAKALGSSYHDLVCEAITRSKEGDAGIGCDALVLPG